MNQQQHEASRKNRRLITVLAAFGIGMFGFGFAMVPLYNLYCDVAGLNKVGSNGGRVAASQFLPGEADTSRLVTVEFDATLNADLPWDFRPLVKRMQVHPGQIYEVAYYAHNRADHAITGQAIPGVTPWQATEHFNKTECFCFTEQKLEAGEGREMPLRFVLSPDLPSEYNTITLSYTFMDKDRSKLMDRQAVQQIVPHKQEDREDHRG